jgi:alpha-methylacyl-CoA racemase
LLETLGLDAADVPQWDRDQWPESKAKLGDIFRSRTRDEWCAAFDGVDACVTPVLTPIEAPSHPHAVARGAFLDVDGVPQPAPAPRFSRTPATVASRPTHAGDDTTDVLGVAGFDDGEIAALYDQGAVA